MFTVVEVDAVVPGGSQNIVTLQFTSAKRYRAKSQFYIPALQQDLVFEQNLFNRGAVSGDVRIGYGDVVVSNVDGRFDEYKFYGFDGQTVRLYVLEDESEPLSQNNLYFTGTLTFAEFTYESIVFSIRDKQEVLNIAHQTSTFLGTNSGPTGYEGLPDDIQGQTKPMLYGYCHNVVPFPVNRSKLIYALNYTRAGVRAAIDGTWDVRDKGGEILYNSSYGDAASLAGATIPAGQYAVCLTEGLFRLGSVPQGDVTCTAQSKFMLGSSAPVIAHRLLTEAGLVPGFDFDEKQLEDLLAKNSCMVGYYLTDDTTTFEIVSQVLSSIGAWISPDRLGVFRFGRFDLPSADPQPASAKFGPHNIEPSSLKRLPSGDDNKGIPIKKLDLRYNKRWKRLTKNEMLVSVEAADKYFFDQDWTSAISEDAAVVATHKLSQSITRETLLVVPRNLKFRNGDFSDPVLTNSYDLVSVPVAATATVVNEQVVMTPSVNGAVALRQAVGSPAATYTVLAKYEELYDNLPLTYGFTLVSGQVIFTARRAGTSVSALTYIVAGKYEVELAEGILASLSGVSIQVTNVNTVTACTLDDLFIRVKRQGKSPEEEAARLRTILSSDLERFVFQAPFSQAKDVLLGSKINLTDQRFDLSAGKDFIVVGKEEDLDSRTITLDVVGAG